MRCKTNKDEEAMPNGIAIFGSVTHPKQKFEKTLTISENTAIIYKPMGILIF